MMFLPLLFVAVALQSEMSPQEKKKTGLYKLNHRERSALQTWIEANYSAKPGAPQKEKPHKSHLEENLQDGNYIRLQDGSTWKIHPNDVNITSAWITPVDITVASSTDELYPYTLTNALTKSTVRAQKVESVPPAAPPEKSIVPPTPPPQPHMGGAGKGK